MKLPAAVKHVVLWGNESGQASRMIGFVPNPDTDPLLLFDMTRELLELISVDSGRRATSFAPSLAHERWLVVTSTEGSSCLGLGRFTGLHLVYRRAQPHAREVYRYIRSQLRMVTDYKKVLMAFGDGCVEALTRGTGLGAQALSSRMKS